MGKAALGLHNVNQMHIAHDSKANGNFC
jgi:hypothetical protein